jgi:cell division protein FtsX
VAKISVLLRYAYISYLVLYIGIINVSFFCLQAIKKAKTTFKPRVKFHVYLESKCFAISTLIEDRTRLLRLAERIIHK